MVDLLRAAAFGLTMLGLSSCASISVEQGTSRVTRRMPEVIYVADFGAGRSDFAVDRAGGELAEFKKNLQLMLRTAMTADLTDRLLPAVAASRPWPGRGRQQNAWLVRGEFRTVNQGSRLLRGAVGFGAGGTKLETRVEVYDLDREAGMPFLTFTTTGGSGAEPGALLAFSTDPLEIAIGGVSGVAHGLSEDTKRTAREITAELSDYMYRRGWISQSQWIKPKEIGGGDVW